MGVSDKRLQEEKTLLQKSFDSLNQKIQTYEKETQVLRNNLNAVHGALQQVDKLIAIGRQYSASVEDQIADIQNKPNWPDLYKKLEIKEKEKAKLLTEKDEKAKKLLGEGEK